VGWHLRQILLTRDTASLSLELGKGMLCVVSKGYPCPLVGTECDRMPWVDFKSNPREIAGRYDGLCVVGMNKMINLKNRTDAVFEFLHNDSSQFRKISVDRTLFVSEAWRSWFHFGFLGAKYREYTYSFLAESHWKAFQDGIRPDDPFSLDEIAKWGKGIIRSDHRRFFDELDVVVISANGDAHDRYRKLKEECFEREHTIGAILKRLAAFASGICEERILPTMSKLFDSYTHRIIVTDLGVDRWLLGRIRETVDLVNGIAGEFYVG